MYASSAKDLEAATEELQQKPQRAHVTRVKTFLERKEEWVLFFRRLGLITRGHSTNNYAEATIRLLKDVVLGRQKAYNVVALVDLVATVWEGYFSRRLLKHAYNRVAAHQVFYEKLVQRMPESAAQSIRALGDSMYEVRRETARSITFDKMSALASVEVANKGHSANIKPLFTACLEEGFQMPQY